jgi:hypothetical protein
MAPILPGRRDSLTASSNLQETAPGFLIAAVESEGRVDAPALPDHGYLGGGFAMPTTTITLVLVDGFATGLAVMMVPITFGISLIAGRSGATWPPTA